MHKWEGRPRRDASDFDDFDFLKVAAMTLECVLGEIGVLVRFNKCDPHGPSAV